MGTQDVHLPPIFDDLDVGIILRDPETGAIMDSNERVESLYGYSTAELKRLDIEDYTAPTATFTQEEAIRRIQAAADGDEQVFNWQIERANGEFRWVRVHLSLTTINDHDAVISEITDITKYKERENLLQLVTRVIRHNLRNDMTVLIGYAERLKSAIETDTLEDEVDTILDVAKEVGTLSDSINEIERITNPDKVERKPMNLREVAQAQAEAVGSSHQQGIAVEGPEEVWVVADEGLQYALKHAIRNAFEHNDQDAPSVTVQIEDATEMAVLSILDNGPPIPEMEIDVIEEATETTSTYHGSGVGLWVMKWCVDSLGGDLTFDQRSPRGNIVSISLPKASPSDNNHH